MLQCVLTGVKEFQFKGCDEFTLIVHVDDGSVITEALIHHKVSSSSLFCLEMRTFNFAH